MSWGNPQDTTENQDMISGVGNHRVLRINDVNDGNDAKIALHAINSSNNAAARALKIEGRSSFDGRMDLDGYFMISGPENGIYTENNDPLLIATTEASGEVIIGNEANGILAHGDMAITGDLSVAGQNIVVGGDDPGRVDAEGAGNVAQDLQIGTQAGTDDVVIGKANHNVEVNGNLRVVPPINALGNLVVGPDNAVGRVDANSTHDLQLGTQSGTDDVVISKSGKNVEIPAAVLDAEGEFRIGATSSAGKVDSGGSSSSPQNLLLGSQNVTADVQLGRSGKIVDVMGAERLNSNACVVNGAASLTATGGAGFVYNSTGHGGGPSIDFYLNGVMVRYVDATGWK